MRPTIRRGDRNEHVGVWQERNNLKKDNNFGAATEAATRAFQRQHGLKDDGIVGPATWRASDLERQDNPTMPSLYGRVQPSQIGWGAYQNWEGPWFKGRRPFDMPAVPTFGDRLLEVVTTTEGGAVDAINMYDRCILTVGAIQWCEAGMLGVSNILSAAADIDATSVQLALKPMLDMTGASFEKVGNVWRFRLNGRTVSGEADQRTLFLGGSGIGAKGTWSAAAKAHARNVAACMANVWMSDGAVEGQIESTRDRMLSFVIGNAKKVLFSDDLQPEDAGGMVGAVRCAYVSFAASLPAVASKQFDAFQKATTATPWTLDWTVELLSQLTYGPGIAIYPVRYDRIRPVLESVWGVNLPDFSAQLRAAAADSRAVSVAEVQEMLQHLGYDIGPSGVDDKWGGKTKAALRGFKAFSKLPEDDVLDQTTLRALRAAA